MQNSTLWRRLQALSASERRAFGEFVRSPFHNKRQDVVKLVEYLLPQLGQRREAISREAVFGAVYGPSVPYDDKQWRYLLSFAATLHDRYLVEVELENDTFQQKLYLVRALRKGGDDALFEREHAAALAWLERQPYRDAVYHHGATLLHHELLEHRVHHQRGAALDYQPLYDGLTTYYLAEMLRHACSAAVHRQISSQEYDVLLLPAVLAYLEAGHLHDTPGVALYFHCLKTLTEPEPEPHYRRLRELLELHWQAFPPAEIRGVYLIAINFCIRRMNSGAPAYIREAFELYQAGLERRLLLENGQLTGFTYKNIIRLGLALNEVDWTLEFLEAYKAFLHPAERENVYRYNLAAVRFHQHDFNRAMPLLQQVELRDALNNLDARRMLLRSYYELGEYQSLDALLTSFAAYIRRQKGIGYHRENYLNLVRFTRRLLELDRSDKAAVEGLRAELEETTQLAEKAWLLSNL
jgi:hypothetical protein